MPEGSFYAWAQQHPEDQYSAFADIFGKPPPPGRIPTYGIAGPAGRSVSMPYSPASPHGVYPPSSGAAAVNSTASISTASPTHPHPQGHPLPQANQANPHGNPHGNQYGHSQVNLQGIPQGVSQGHSTGHTRAPVIEPPAVAPRSMSTSAGMPTSPSELKHFDDAAAAQRLTASASSIDLSNGSKRGSGDEHSMTRSVSQVWSGLKKQVNMQRSASSTVVSSRKQVTKGGRAIPMRSEVGAFASMYNNGPTGLAITTDQSATGSGGGAGGSGSGSGGGGANTTASTADSTLVGDDHGRSLPSRKSSSATVSSLGGRSTVVASSRREPLVYPALLSKVSQKFRERMAPVLGDRVKNELTYKNAFTGAEAVDVIAYIIKTPDRNLALLLGRSLDAQKLFHDVTYDNRLRDSVSEVYQFTTYDGNSEAFPEPNGVFTLLSECYSPTCSRNRLCYSISCPRRLEQQARLNMKLDPGLLSQHEASISLNEAEETEEKLWRWTVAPEVLEATPPKEQKRQEAIAELVYTERQFVKSLEFIRESWIKPLRRSNVLGPEARRDKFIRMVFLNVLEIHAVNLKLAETLTRRQQQSPVVHQIADIMLEFAPRFDPFVTYGAQQMYAKYEFEKERALNPAFAKLVQQIERSPESQQLELNGYLTKPTTRLARYPLLLDAILKRTEQDNPDFVNIPTAIAQIREFLFKVNAASGKTENRFSLHQLNQALTFRAGEWVDLHLLDPKRQLVFKGQLHKRPPPGEGNVQVYLFDHAILFAKRKKVSGLSSSAAAAAAAAAAAVEPPTGDDASSGLEVLRVNSKPIPLQLLQLAESDEIGRRKAAAHMIRTTVTRNAEGKATFPITFQHLGRRNYEVVLYAENFQARKTWIETILKQQEAQRLSASIFSQQTLYTSSPSVSGKAQCATSLSDGRRVLFGTEKGVFVTQLATKLASSSGANGGSGGSGSVAGSNGTNNNNASGSGGSAGSTGNESEAKPAPPPTALKMILRTNAPVTQIDAVEKYGVLLILTDRTLYALPLDIIDSNADDNTRQRALKSVASPVTFYKVDECAGRTLLTVVKSTHLNSVIRVFEPVAPSQQPQKRPQLRRLLTSGGSSLGQFDGFKPVKPPIDVPSATLSLSFLRSHLCLGCSRGFELLDLEHNKFESLLDPADTSLDFVIKRETLKPISLYRIGKEFLLNYSDFSFFINRNGWRSRPDWIIMWECTPQYIVLSYPYLIAFDHNLIEIRNMDTELIRVIHGERIRLLHEFQHDILYAVENERGQDEVVSLNFRERPAPQRKS